MTPVAVALPDGDRAVAIAAQVEGFMADPFFGWLLPDDKIRRRWLQTLMWTNVRLYRGRELMLGTGQPEHGALLAARPDGYPVPLATELWADAALIAASMRAGFWRRRLLKVGLAALQQLQAWHIKGPHWYLATFSLAPACQGKGYGGALLSELLAEADQTNLPVYLETSNPANLGFYGRFGFKEIGQFQLPAETPPVWAMLRAAQKEPHVASH